MIVNAYSYFNNVNKISLHINNLILSKKAYQIGFSSKMMLLGIKKEPL